MWSCLMACRRLILKNCTTFYEDKGDENGAHELSFKVVPESETVVVKELLITSIASKNVLPKMLTTSSAVIYRNNYL